MNTKSIEMIYMLLKNNEVYTIKDFSYHFELSNRMIRVYLDNINKFLKPINSVVRIDNQGYLLLEGDRHLIEKKLNNLKYQDYRVLQEERMIIIFLELLSNIDHYITLESISNKISVSRSTLVKDFKEFKELMKKNDVMITSKSSHGIKIKRYSDKVDLYYIRLLLEKYEFIQRYLDIKIKSSTKCYYKMLEIEKTILESENLASMYLSPRSFNILAYYLCLTESIEYKLDQNKDYHASRFGRALLSQSKQFFNNNSKINLEILLSNLRFVERKQDSHGIIKLQMVTREFIEGISEYLNINLNNNYMLYESLSAHLCSVMSNKNPILYDLPEVKKIVADKKAIKKSVDENIYILEQVFHREITHLEKKYIVIYVAAAIEQMKNSLKFDVLIVCDSGLATAQLLKAKIIQNILLNRVDISSSRSVTLETVEKYDLIISTVPISHSKKDNLIKVTPMLSNRELQKINSKIDNLKEKRLVESKKKILSTNCEKNRKQQRFAPIEEILRNETFLKLPKLSEILEPEYIQVDCQAENWKEAIILSSEMMINNSDIEPQYVQRMISNVEEYGPYIVISPGIAFPHGDYESGSNKLAMSLIILKTPVFFGQKEYDPVEIVCALSPIDDSSHLRAFFTIVNLLQNNYYKDLILNASEANVIFEIIKSYERSIDYGG